jgi:multicomponent Na+:H+ antiporter subunit C
MTNQLDTAVLVAVLAAAGFYLCTSRRLLRVLFGFLLLSNAANLVLLGVSGDPSGRVSPVVGADKDAAVIRAAGHADPLPQALILTAIVIGFAVAAYLTVLIYRLYCDRGAATVPALHAAGPAPEGTPAAEEELRRERAVAAAPAQAVSPAGKGGHA